MLTSNLPESTWSIPDRFPNFEHSRIISVDLETRDPRIITHGPGWCRDDGHVAGIGIGDENCAYYFPIGHERGQNMDKDVVVNWVREVLSNPRQPKVMFNKIYDLGWLKWLGIEVQGDIEDPSLMVPILDENRRRYNLDSVAKDYLGHQKDETLLTDACKAFGFANIKGSIWRLPSQYVGPYGEQDVRLNVALYDHLKPILEQENLMQIYILERDLGPMLLDMRAQGCPVDMEKGQKLADTMLVQETEARKALKGMAGGDVDIWSNVELAKAYDKMDKGYIILPPTQNMLDKGQTVGNPSFAAPWLMEQAKTDDFAKALLTARRKNRARSTYTDGIIQEHSHKGRIHCQFNQLKSDEYGTVTGRFSASTPNLQQIPIRDPEIGSLIRSLFIAEDGCRWLKADYAQQEPRLTVHYAFTNKCVGADETVAKYLDDPHLSFHLMVANELWPEEFPNLDPESFEYKYKYKQAKDTNLAGSYGQGVASLAKKLGMSLEECKSFKQRYFKMMPFLKELNQMCKDVASDRGFVTTILKRKCRFPDWQPKDFDIARVLSPQRDRVLMGAMTDEYIKKLRSGAEPMVTWDGKVKKKIQWGTTRAWVYRALNKKIQGSAADMLKKAMLDCYDAGYLPSLTIHDELDFPNITEDSEIVEIKEIMESSVKLAVPLVCDMEIGTNWGDIKAVDFGKITA